MGKHNIQADEIYWMPQEPASYAGLLWASKKIHHGETKKKKKRKQKWDLLTLIALDSKTAKINSG